jgi:hypothetical protein
MLGGSGAGCEARLTSAQRNQFTSGSHVVPARRRTRSLRTSVAARLGVLRRVALPVLRCRTGRARAHTGDVRSRLDEPPRGRGAISGAERDSCGSEGGPYSTRPQLFTASLEAFNTVAAGNFDWLQREGGEPVRTAEYHGSLADRRTDVHVIGIIATGGPDRDGRRSVGHAPALQRYAGRKPKARMTFASQYRLPWAWRVGYGTVTV